MFDLETLKKLEKTSYWTLSIELIGAILLLAFYKEIKPYFEYLDFFVKLIVFLIVPIDIATYFFIKYRIKKLEGKN
jgi:Na+/H+-dicarboxylate symporter